MNIRKSILCALGCVLFIVSCNNRPTLEIKTAEKSKSPVATNSVAASIKGEIDINKEWVLGHFEPKHHPDFVRVDSIYADRAGLYLHKETYTAFKKMWTAAKSDGIDLIIRSATRNHIYQKGIWERKWTGETLLEGKTNAQKDIKDPVERCLAILRYSSMPGSSRHHWGTDIDLNAFDNHYFGQGGKWENLYNWMKVHAATYGFCQVYTDKNSENRHGYEEEKWHWSYLPLAEHLDTYLAQHITSEEISGFLGSDHSVDVQIVRNYMQGISSSCKK